MAFLWRHPLWTLGLALLSMTLAALGPLLQIKAHLADDPMVAGLLTLVAMLPLELYFVPRFLLALDAEALDHPCNPRESWKSTFETRWLQTIGAKLALSLALGIAFMCFFFPALVVLVLFGWTPLRVLLRGESLVDAARASARLMARLWPRVVFTVATAVMLYLLAILVMLAALGRFLPETLTPQTWLAHPAAWGVHFAESLLNLWMSATLLALFHQVELYDPVPESSSEK